MTAPVRLIWRRIAPDHRQLVVDCEHYRTRLDLDGKAPFSDADLVFIAAAFHRSAAGCRCAEGARA